MLNGRYETLTNIISKIALTFSYSADISRFNRIKKYKSKNKQKTKILKFEKLREFIKNELNNKQSLKAIGGRSKLAYLNGEIEQPISVMTLYSYINNENVLLINRSHLKRKWKHKYRTRNYCKRQNGVSISERPEYINQNNEFGHWEMDLVISKKSNVNLLTLYERKSKIGMVIKYMVKKLKPLPKH